MKIELKEVELNIEGKPMQFSYKKALIMTLRNTRDPNSKIMGFTFDEVKKRQPIIEKLEKANKEIELTKEEHELIKKLVNSEKWKIIDQKIIDYVNYINEVK